MSKKARNDQNLPLRRKKPGQSQKDRVFLCSKTKASHARSKTLSHRKIVLLTDFNIPNSNFLLTSCRTS